MASGLVRFATNDARLERNRPLDFGAGFGSSPPGLIEGLVDTLV
jgi:hypothetical protein